jgi:PAS domain S-box-containing protein
MRNISARFLVSVRRILSGSAMRYEAELYSVLALILLFLLLVNLSSIRIVAQLNGIFEDQVYEELLESARVARDYLGENPDLMSSTAGWENLAQGSFADSTLVAEIGGSEKGSAADIFSGLTHEQMELLQRGDLVAIDPDESEGESRYDLLVPFMTAENRSYVVKVSKLASRHDMIANISLFHLVFHILGVVAIVILGYMYLRVTLKPYQTMKKAAEDAAITRRTPGGSVDQIVKSFQKMIAELKEKENILQELYEKSQIRAERLEQFNEYILAGMASGLISCDRDGIVTHFNRTAQRILGLGERDVIGRCYSESLENTPELVSLIEASLEDAVNSNRCELVIDGPDGRSLSLGVSTTLITDELGRRVGATVIMTDITEIKRLQSEVAFKEKMAALGETAAGLAHELRNSMTAIVGYGKLMARLVHDNPQIMQVAESIAREGMATEEMLARFLEFARPAQLSLESVIVHDVVGDLVEGLVNHAKGKNVSIEFRSDDEGSSILGDQLALRQAVSNLIVNAIEASKPGEAVGVELSAVESGKTVRISVSDSGSGIPESLRAKIFTPFFTTKENGTGLGLCTAQKLVAAMGGRIVLSPPDSAGFSVSMLLPAAQRDVRAVLAAEAADCSSVQQRT